MKLFSKFIFIGSALTVFACHNSSQSKAQNETDGSQKWALGDQVQTSDRLSYIFSWTNDSRYVTNPNATIEEKLSSSRLRNSQGHAVDFKTSKAGAGIYGATDPLVSKSFGKYLLVLPVAPHKTLTALAGSMDGEQYLKIVSSDAKAVIYPWESYLRGADGTLLSYAAVIRDSSLLDLSKLAVIGPIEPDYSCLSLSKLDKLGTSWVEGLRSASKDFYFCTGPLFARYASYYYSASQRDRFMAQKQDMPLLFAASLRYGSYLVELAGVKSRDVDCGASGFCALKFGHTVVNAILKKSNASPIPGTSFDDDLSFEQARDTAKKYRLLAEEANPVNMTELLDAISQTLQKIQPDFEAKLTSHIEFYNDLMAAVAKESMLDWK